MNRKMLTEADLNHLRGLLADTMKMLCKATVPFCEELIVSGHVGLNIDKACEYILDFHEVVACRQNSDSDMSEVGDDHNCEFNVKSSKSSELLHKNRRKIKCKRSKGISEESKNVNELDILINEVETLAAKADNEKELSDRTRYVKDSKQFLTNDQRNGFEWKEQKSPRLIAVESQRTINSPLQVDISEHSEVDEVWTGAQYRNVQHMETIDYLEQTHNKNNSDIIQCIPINASDLNAKAHVGTLPEGLPGNSGGAHIGLPVEQLCSVNGNELVVIAEETHASENTDIDLNSTLINQEEIIESNKQTDILHHDMCLESESPIEISQVQIAVQGSGDELPETPENGVALDHTTEEEIEESVVYLKNEFAESADMQLGSVELVYDADIKDQNVYIEQGEGEQAVYMLRATADEEGKAPHLASGSGDTLEYCGVMYQIVDSEVDHKPTQTSLQLPNVESENDTNMFVTSVKKGNRRKGKKANKFMCSICSQLFTTHWGVKLHERLHRGDYRYHCGICNQGFISTANLRGHLMKHAPNEKLKCELCGKTFTYKQSFERHMQSSASGNTNSCIRHRRALLKE